VALGVSTSLLGGFFAEYQAYIIRLGGIILILLGLFYLDIIKISFFNRQYMMQLEQKPVGLAGSFVVGLTFSLGWTPCVGPALSSILIVASMAGKTSHGTYLLSLYSLGLAIPFVVSSLLFDKLFILLKRFGFIAQYAVKVLGALLILLGLLMVSSYYMTLNLWIGTLLPSGV
jgi:cytochrome c-type biogenesis protein